MLKHFGLVSIILLVLAGCAPAVSSLEIAQKFTVEIDDLVLQPQGDTFSFGNDTYSLRLILSQSSISYDLTNKTDLTIRLLFDESVIVLPNGQASRIISGNTRFKDIGGAQPAATVPSQASDAGVFFPEAVVDAANTSIDNMFAFPLRQPITLRLLLALEVEGQKIERDISFIGNP